jgi:hypothetical protein
VGGKESFEAKIKFETQMLKVNHLEEGRNGFLLVIVHTNSF